MQSSLVAASSNNKIKLSCLDKLLDIAKYYNQCWEPNWNNTNEYKFSIIYDHGLKRYVISKTTTKIETCVYFKNYKFIKRIYWLIKCVFYFIFLNFVLLYRTIYDKIS